MLRYPSILASAAMLTFATFSSSPHYQLNNYSVGGGATNSSASTTYKLQGSVGEQANGSTSGSTKTAKNGSIQTEQLNVPPAPTLSNGSGTFSNKLNCIVNTGGNPGDTTYAIAVSTNSFATTNYVQAGGALGGSPVYQSYSAWGSGSGSLITGLSPSTTYEVKVAAKQGLFTNTEYGAFATASTVSAASLTFSVSPNSASLGTFLPNTIVTSSSLSFTFATSSTYGGTIYVLGQNSGFKSPSTSHTIAAFSGNLTGTGEGFGIQATNPNQTSGGPLTTVSPFNGTGNVVGAESTALQPMLTTGSAIVGGTANANVQVKASVSDPPASDYQEVFTFVATASF